MEDEDTPTFKQETVMKILQNHFKDSKTKVSADAAKLIVEVLRLFVAEAAGRAGNRAKSEDVNLVHIDHFEKILPQLLLDF